MTGRIERDGPWRLLALGPLSEDSFRTRLGLPADGVIELVVSARRDRGAARAALSDADLVLADWSGQVPLTAAEVAIADRLAFVQQPSTGFEGIDVTACADHGIPVANTGGANADSVAQWCVGASLWLVRSLGWADAQVRRGHWPQLEVARHGSRGACGMPPVGPQNRRPRPVATISASLRGEPWPASPPADATDGASGRPLTAWDMTGS